MLHPECQEKSVKRPEDAHNLRRDCKFLAKLRAMTAPPCEYPVPADVRGSNRLSLYSHYCKMKILLLFMNYINVHNYIGEGRDTTGVKFRNLSLGYDLLQLNFRDTISPRPDQ